MKLLQTLVFLQALKSVYLTKSTKIILDCSKDTLFEVMTQAQQIGMVSEDYFYMLTSVDAHTVDLSNFKVCETRVVVYYYPAVRAYHLIFPLFSTAGQTLLPSKYSTIRK